MLTQIGVEVESGEIIIPILGVSPKESLLIQKVTGLNPPDVSLFIGDYSRDGGTYQGRRVGNRNPVFTFTLNPNPALGETISGLRQILHKTFLDPLVDADYLKVNLYDDLGRVWYMVGYTEKFEHEVFDVETASQISMICPDPYLRDNAETVLDNSPGWTTVPFSYTGTAETGFKTTIVVNTATSVLTLDNNGKTMVLTRDFAVNDVVEIDTIRGERSITVTPDGESSTSILGSLSYLSDWLELHSQSNTLKVYGTDSTNLVAAITELRFTQAYWGI